MIINISNAITPCNSFTINIVDEKVPVVILFGPPASGKFMFIIRMTRYLEKLGYSVVPEVSFRPCSDISYKRWCENFRECAYSVYQPIRTPDFLLVKVVDPKGSALCQILYAPGEFYFDPCCFDDSNMLFPTLLEGTPNRKIWIFFVEQGWGESQEERNLYAQKICNMQNLISPNDKVVFLFNKVDKQIGCQYNEYGKPSLSSFFSNIRMQYPHIFDKFQNTGLSKLFYGKFRVKTWCFTSGLFSLQKNGRYIWTLSEDWYCSGLWKIIKKYALG